MSKQIQYVKQDAIVVWGAKDEILDPKNGREFAKLLPHARLSFFHQNCCSTVLSRSQTSQSSFAIHVMVHWLMPSRPKDVQTYGRNSLGRTPCLTVH